jgi:hypothetical protein
VIRISKGDLATIEVTLAPEGRVNVCESDHVDRTLTHAYIMGLGGDVAAFDAAFGVRSSYSVEDVLAWLDAQGGVS